MNYRTIALIAVLAALASGASAASFDCTKARTPVEHMICADPALSALDERLDLAYRGEQARDRQLRVTQHAWLVDTRNQCTTTQCLTQAYSARLEALRAHPSACAITQQALLGSWINVDQNSEGFEEADFLNQDGQQGFVSFVRHVPYVTGTWTLKNCRIHIDGSGDRTDFDLSVAGFERGRLTLKDESEGTVLVFKQGRPAK